MFNVFYVSKQTEIIYFYGIWLYMNESCPIIHRDASCIQNFLEYHNGMSWEINSNRQSRILISSHDSFLGYTVNKGK